MPPTTLSTLEGQENIPRGEVLQRLADFFRVPVTYFYSDPQPPTRGTDAARQYLKRLQQPVHAAETVATQANVILDEGTKKKLAELIKKNAQAPNK